MKNVKVQVSSPEVLVQSVTKKSEQASISTISDVYEFNKPVEWTNKQTWLWPEGEVGLKTSFGDCFHINDFIDLVPDKRVVVQAGGACGVYPKYLIQYFSVVYTFEPNPDLFRCLLANADEPDIFKFPMALTNRQKMVHLETNKQYDGNNRGAYWIGDGGYVPGIPLDYIDFPAVDLIILDLEGTECQALAGAKKTIRDHAPMIIVEDKPKCRERFEVPSDWIDSFCKAFDYEKIGQKGCDVVLKHGKK